MGAYEDYPAALAKFNEAHSEIDAIATNFSIISKYLQEKRGAFCFSNAGGGIPLSFVSNPNVTSVNADHWKSATQINECLSRWRDARQNLLSVWNSLSESQRRAFAPLPATATARDSS